LKDPNRLLRARVVEALGIVFKQRLATLLLNESQEHEQNIENIEEKGKKSVKKQIKMFKKRVNY
jgi:hypothetical protein